MKRIEFDRGRNFDEENSNPARVRTDQGFATSIESGKNGGNPGGNFTTDFLTTLNDRLTAGGFTNQQIERIVSALQDCMEAFVY